MIPLEKQVTSLEVAKELKEAGYPQEGLWWWQVYHSGNIYLIPYKKSKGFIDKSIDSVCDYFVAPTCSELGERLPKELKHKTYKIYLKHYFNDKWTTSYYEIEYDGDSDVYFQYADTEANARAKMWLYLKKEGKL